MAEWLGLLTSYHVVPDSVPVGNGIQLMTVRHIITLSLSLSPFHRLSQYDLNNVERDVKHQTIIIINCKSGVG